MGKVLFLGLVLLLSSFAEVAFTQVAFAQVRVNSQRQWQAKDPEYFRDVALVDRALILKSGVLLVSDERIPTDIAKARELFVKICEPNVENYRYQKAVTVDVSDKLTQFNFRCETKDNFSAQSYVVQFIASLDVDSSLADLQILQAENTFGQTSKWNPQEGKEVLVAVAAGTLVSGLLAAGIYPGQEDKILHAIAGNLIAISAAAISCYGFDVSKNQAFWIGLAAGILAGVLKEVYDSHHPDKHSADRRDIVATSTGALTGAFAIRLKFRF